MFSAMRGTQLVGEATSHFHAVAVTTTGTIQGSSSKVLNSPGVWIFCRSSRASPRPTIQLPNTPTMQ